MKQQQTSPYLKVLGGLDLQNHYHLQYKNLFILAFIAISNQIDRDDLSNVFYAEASNRRSSLRGCINKINKEAILQSKNNFISLSPTIHCDLYELRQALETGDHKTVRQLYRDADSKLLNGAKFPKKSSMDLELWLEELNKILVEKAYISRVTLLAEELDQQSHYELSLIAKECLSLFPYEIDPFEGVQESYVKAAKRLFDYLQSFNIELAGELRDKVWQETDQQIDLLTPAKASQTNLKIIGAVEESKIAHFKGRQKESTKLFDFFVSKNKVIQILGRAGIGKTSFATKFIRDISGQNPAVTPEYFDSISQYKAILFTNLDANSPKVLAELLFRIFNKEELKSVQSFWENDSFPLDYKWERLFNESLKDTPIIVILDNLESYLENNALTNPELASFIKVFLNTKHESKLIITSRYELITEELVRRPDLATQIRLAKLSNYDSIELLKARDDNQGRFINASQEQLLELIKRCHGIPKIYDVLLMKLRKEPLTNLDMLLQSQSIETVLATPAQVMLEQLDSTDLSLLETLSIFTEAVPLDVMLYMHDSENKKDNEFSLAQLNALVNSAAIIMDEQQHLSLHPLDREYLLKDILPQTPTKLEALHVKAAQYYREQRKDKEAWLEPTDLSPQLNEFKHFYQAGQINPIHFDEAARALSDIEFGYLLSWGKSRDLLEKRQTLIGKISDPMLIGKNFNSLGVAAMNLRLFNQSINYLGQSIYHYRKIKTPIALRMSFHSIGNLATVFSKIGKFEIAIKLYRYNIDLTEKLANSEDVIEKEMYESLAVDYTLIADTYAEAGNYQKALVSYDTAQSFYTDVVRKRYPHFYSACYLGLAKTHFHLQNESKAREFAITSNRVARENTEHSLTIESLCLKAIIECKADNYQQALDLFNTALSLSSKIGEVNLEIDTYAAMYKAFKEKEPYTEVAQNSLERGVSLAEQIKNERQRAMFFEV